MFRELDCSRDCTSVPVEQKGEPERAAAYVYDACDQ